MNPSGSKKTSQNTAVKNPLESLRDVGTDTVKSAASSVTDLGTGFFDQLLGVDSPELRPKKESSLPKIESRASFMPRQEHKTIWSMQQERETRTIRELLEQVKQEVKMIKKADAALIQEIKDIDSITINNLPEATIYHTRFLELIISILRTLRLKISESRTWLSTFKGKSTKRGFRAMSKKKGTSFSMSQELATARAVQ